MKFGIFYEHQLPRPWEEDGEYRLMQDALEQVELADRLGFDVVWEVEHHFLEEYSHSSAPEVFLGACSQRTKDIRLGHGIIQTAPGYNHPARTAERVATLDLLSGGRVEFGSGESGSEAELGGFLVDPATKREAWLEGLQVALRCMTETPFTGVDGHFVQMPPRNVVPKPMQKPHPPLWVACSPARHDPAGGREWDRRPHVRLHRPRRGGEVGVGLRAHAGGAVRPGRVGRQPEHRVRHPDDVPSRREGGARPGPRGRQLLRLLARPLLRLRRAPAGIDRRLARVPGPARRGGVLARAGDGPAPGAPRGQAGGRRPHGPARGDGHAGADARVPRALRGGRRRPGHLRAAGRDGTATSTSASRSSSSAARCCQPSRSATRPR